MGPARKDANARILAAAVNVGLGSAQVRLLASVLDMPLPSNNAWMASEAFMFPAMEECGAASTAAALVEERVAALTPIFQKASNRDHLRDDGGAALVAPRNERRGMHKHAGVANGTANRRGVGNKPTRIPGPRN